METRFIKKLSVESELSLHSAIRHAREYYSGMLNQAVKCNGKHSQEFWQKYLTKLSIAEKELEENFYGPQESQR